MARTNPKHDILLKQVSYYTQVAERVGGKLEEFRVEHPQRKLWTLGFGDTSQPLFPNVVEALEQAVRRLGDKKTFTGYGPVQGIPELRNRICTLYYQERMGVSPSPDELFLGEGSHAILGTLHELFDPNTVVAIQDPYYPVMNEANLLEGWTNRVYLPCNEQNGFIPELPSEEVGLIYLCFPNNPTGAAASRAQLKAFVDYAQTHHAIIIFDSVYGNFVTDPEIPRSIYEIEGARECAIELGSFSKMANFTGLRLGWCVIPKALRCANTQPGELLGRWTVKQWVKSWGVSNLAQQGGMALLTEEGLEAMTQNCAYYLENARLLRERFESRGFTVVGGKYASYLWVKVPEALGMNSWEFFCHFLEKTGIAGIPGSFMGSQGEGYIRLSTFADREELSEAMEEGLSQW